MLHAAKKAYGEFERICWIWHCESALKISTEQNHAIFARGKEYLCGNGNQFE